MTTAKTFGAIVVAAVVGGSAEAGAVLDVNAVSTETSFSSLSSSSPATVSAPSVRNINRARYLRWRYYQQSNFSPTVATDDTTPSASVPEPDMLLLLGAGLATLGAFALRRSAK